jgi:hypothetical protein
MGAEKSGEGFREWGFVVLLKPGRDRRRIAAGEFQRVLSALSLFLMR